MTRTLEGRNAMPKRTTLILALIALALVLAGCKTIYQQAIDAGYPPSYAEGLMDGHSSGQSAAGNWTFRWRKNLDGSEIYDEGWADGFQIGKGRYENARSAVHYLHY